MANHKTAVRLDHLSKIYQDPKTGEDFYAVHDANITMEPGSFTCLLGPSGCGKTTILRMIAGFESPDEGEIYFDDQPVNKITPNKRDTAMVFQSYALLPHYNIFDNIAYGLKLRKMDAGTIKSKVTNIMHLVGLDGMEDRMTNQLSGGQQQRVALARALVIEPGVLLFDEPLSNLDAKLRVDMRTEIRRIQQEAGITAIYVTHDQSEAMAIADQIIIMKKGVVDQVGTGHEVYNRPCDEFVANFIGESNFLRGKLATKDAATDSGVVSYAGQDVKIRYVDNHAAGDDVVLVLRPEAATVADQGQLKGEVVLSRFMGAYQDYRIKVGEDVLKIQVYNPRNKKVYEVGDTAWVNFDPADVHVL